MKLGKLLISIVVVSLLVSMALPMVSAPKPPGGGGKPPATPADPAISFHDGYWGPLKVMNEDGSNLATIIEEGIFSVAGKLSWSPTGDALAWAGRIADGSEGVWRIDIDVVNGVPQGSNMQRLVDESASGDDVRYAAWSPLGDEIAYASRHATSNNWWIKVVPAEGGPIETIYETYEIAINLMSLTWSSDGTRIAFVATEMEGNPGDQYITILERATGTVTHTLLKGQFRYMWIEWARDLDTLIMSAEDPAPSSIYTVDINDPTPVKVVEEDKLPCWSPDNTKFVCMITDRRKPAIGVYDLTTGEITRLVSGDGPPDWRRF